MVRPESLEAESGGMSCYDRLEGAGGVGDS